MKRIDLKSNTLYRRVKSMKIKERGKYLGKKLLTTDQRLEWMVPPNGERELATYYTFSQHDLEIIHCHRGNYNPIRLCRPISTTPLCGNNSKKDIKFPR
ncbi:DUF4158 domain-containing protein [Peribacillus frigoritolerans]|nr:DUF4158 domain-containing protein [Peribacillus frigoritolerans]